MRPKRLRLAAFSMVIIAAFSPVEIVRAQQTPAEGSASAKSPEHARTQRPKPQVIYNVNSASREAAAALHAQSKTIDTSLDIDPSMPISLQISRANANAAAQATPVQSQPESATKSKEPRRSRARARARRATVVPSITPAKQHSQPEGNH